jgi:hypothetical protein
VHFAGGVLVLPSIGKLGGGVAVEARACRMFNISA